MKKLVFSIAAAFLIFIPSAPAEMSHPLLNEVASYFANRPVTVKCKTPFEDHTLVNAWGYVWIPPEKQKYTTLDQDIVCVGALAIKSNTPEIRDIVKVVGVIVLIHESFHLRRIKNNTKEGLTQCRAFRHLDVGMKKLGASKETLDKLMPLAIFYNLMYVTILPEYNYFRCTIPKRYYKWLPLP